MQFATSNPLRGVDGQYSSAVQPSFKFLILEKAAAEDLNFREYNWHHWHGVTRLFFLLSPSRLTAVGSLNDGNPAITRHIAWPSDRYHLFLNHMWFAYKDDYTVMSVVNGFICRKMFVETLKLWNFKCFWPTGSIWKSFSSHWGGWSPPAHLLVSRFRVWTVCNLNWGQVIGNHRNHRFHWLLEHPKVQGFSGTVPSTRADTGGQVSRVVRVVMRSISQ